MPPTPQKVGSPEKSPSSAAGLSKGEVTWKEPETVRSPTMARMVKGKTREQNPASTAKPLEPEPEKVNPLKHREPLDLAESRLQRDPWEVLKSFTLNESFSGLVGDPAPRPSWSGILSRGFLPPSPRIGKIVEAPRLSQ